ncbi:outer membrane lipoprotein-sorting protein [Sporohalobacter salinus]|uniref:outer membrane lipoprotein-sorting protein n=1 Tax=Sporohalobacter salinus TaxID=1494606 RepID=UPI001960897C|nr:outer membrane lipoprotein-sorting protein [Sporohalobacter salinus]MBM7624109.1 hypothetical protein [Sporohalobacter salinus]
MRLKIKAISLIVLMLILIGVGSGFASEITGKKILDKAETSMDYGHFKGKSKMIIYTTSGDKRVLKMKMWGKGTEKSMMKYYAPSRVEGVAFLYFSNDIWSYFPRTGRTRHLASHIKNQKMMGSSFNYEDFSNDIFDDYQGKLIKEERFKEKKCYVVKAKAKNETTAYDQYIAWITKEEFTPLKIDYYNKGRKIKEMRVKAFLNINEDIKVKKMVMKDLREDDKTVFKYSEIKTGVNFRPNFFHKRNLERISHR